MDYNIMINQIADELFNLLRISKVIEEVKSIYYGNDELKKKAYSKILFLATSPEASQWVEDAFNDWRSNPLTEDDNHFCDIDKLLIIKAFREVRNLKRKRADTLPVTADEVVAKFLEWMSVNDWNKIHAKREG